MWQLGIEERGPFELGEPVFAELAIEQSVMSFAEMIDDKEIVFATSAVRRAVGILAAKPGEVVRGHGASWADP